MKVWHESFCHLVVKNGGEVTAGGTGCRGRLSCGGAEDFSPSLTLGVW